jgi:hypothetical protein
MTGYHMAVVAGVVFFVVRAAGAGPGARRRLSDQEMGGRGGARGIRLLSAVVRRGSRDAKIVLHDRGVADRGHRRPPRHHVPHAGAGRDDRARDRAGGAGASELPEVGLMFGLSASFGA